jgi:hypothetical protein
MYEDGQFDHRSLAKAEIEYALQHIDGSKFPMNLANARAALDARNSGAYWVEKLLGVIIAGIRGNRTHP